MPAADRTAAHRVAAPHHRATGMAARRQRLPDTSHAHWWLLLPVIAPLTTPLYNRVEPRLSGVPFFYWFQLGLAALSTVVITLVHLMRRKS
jgi:hypothetical protein